MAGKVVATTMAVVMITVDGLPSGGSDNINGRGLRVAATIRRKIWW